MPRYVALLRGINLGGKRKVSMEQLRALLGSLGHTEVATLLQSGNAVFSSSERSAEKVRVALESALAETFGFEVRVVLRTREALARAVADNPLEGAEAAPPRFLVVFLSGKLRKADAEALEALAVAPEVVAVRGDHLYARFPNGIGRSKLATSLMTAKLEGLTATARNWSTVQKLLALAG